MSRLEFDDGETHVTDLSASFYSHFQATKNDISARLENLDASGAKANTGAEAFNSLSSDIIKLRKDLVDATSYLPSYDRGKCEQQIKALEESLSRHRATKSKFGFKRKPANTSPSPTTISPVRTPSSHSSNLVPATTNLTLSSHASTHLTLSSLSLPSRDAASESIPRSSDITLTDLTNCIVDLFTPQNHSGSLRELTITALHARTLHRVVIVLPPIEGSVLLHDVQDSVIVVGCHQFRMHDSRNTTVFLHALSTPIIEGSNDIQFAEYPAVLRNVCTSSSSQSFFTRPSQHTLVQDFDWIEVSTSPHWNILDPSSKLVDDVVRLVNIKSRLGDDLAEATSILTQVLPSK